MSKPKRNRAYKASLLVGVSLLIVGIALWMYTNSVIDGHEQILNGSDLTDTERYRWEGSLEWWRDAKRARYDPVSVILVIVGICAIEYGVIYIIAQPKRKIEVSTA